MTSRHSSLPYFQQQPLAGQFPQQPPTSSFLSPNSTAAAAPDHIPLTMRDDTNGFATGTTRSSDSFRQRHFKRPNETDDPFDDVDLSMDYDSKIFKARQRKAIADSKARKRDWRISLALTAWALYIRLWRISQPSSVVFDEVHFGGFASKYIKTRFFMDVHPPLAKMLIALVAKLAGFDGGFDFKDIGKDYIGPGVPYISMRVFCALNGVLTVPIAYWTMRQSGHSVASAVVAALMVCYENGLITNNRHILLDPVLLSFTAATALVWVNFHNQQNRPFQFWWYFWLALTGLGLGLTVSCKWVGLFMIATVGVSTVKNLWEIWGDTRVPVPIFIRHFMARAFCLIVLPITVYMLMFGIHFHSLPNSGEGNGFMSPEFQQTLAGHKLADTPVDIAYGSRVYIRHMATRGGYLHSHPHDYPTGSKQQQVTLYPHRDDNNWWTIYKKDTEQVTGIEYIKHGDIVRLIHNDSNKRLHSHDHRPPMTDLDYHNEVSTYGFPGFDGDANDYWRVEIVDHDKHDPESKDRLRTLHSKFRLVHVLQNCALFSHSVKLPEWGWGQQEVTCIKNGKKPKTMWYIESTENALLPPDTERVNYRRPGFLAKFMELNKVMWDVNKGLTSSHPYDSRPSAWPLLRRGINFWGRDFRHLYLLGNPLVYWMSTASIVIYVAFRAILLLLDKRGIHIQLAGLRKFYDESAGFFLVGWILHYIPFFLMGRQLFLHHYMPALYFSILLFGVVFDFVTVRLVSKKRTIAAVLVVLCVITVYRQFIPITYAEPWTKKECMAHKWRSTWDFDCVQFHDEISQYHGNRIEGNAFGKMQNALKSYFAKDKELPPEVADVVNIVSDAIKAPAAAESSPADAAINDQQSIPSP
ncbi:mannosyltransferase 1 [Lichtheimia corymbifera JMRC:FSU:9682]|uniref:Dolichyl-phosphate-mannose--protein mannosyltransferase n=1 Tax=Lichtheimia corymbifera JMRC:FSU:9682 TaxID=1263082 RepID=A0A068S0K4_9FUNG|nr:mannosyltransferase 1 [Lichtheimia corymbifera JMRC:FSU:9682]